MQVRQKAGHFSASVQVVLAGSQHELPFLLPPVQVHAPLVHW
jgi:hypothetical protein